MSTANFKFDSHQQYQLDAINAVVDLFDGQPKDAQALVATLHGTMTAREGELDLSIAQEVGAIGNALVLDYTAIFENLQKVQDRNGLEVSDRIADGKLDFDVEMETGTGKTYVYLRTIFELAEKYGFRKFIVLVPSVAIREGVNTSIRLMHEHFRDLYPAQPFDASVYSGKTAEEVQAFATSTNVQILVMTIDSIRGDANNRIIHQYRDKLNGLRPIDYLKATRPVVIMDEPQNMESELSQSSIGELEPAFILRYSATHKRERNLVYRLDPVDAHDLGLVKQIVVAEVQQQGADAAPYAKLVAVRHAARGWTAKLELACRRADGTIERKLKVVKPNQELSDNTVTGNQVYEGWRINEITLDPPSIELTNHGMLMQGESIGGNNDAIYREMIRETVREHLKKEAALRPRGIKVLSLFFVDKVVGFLGDGSNNATANGDFARWFDEIFVEERGKSTQYRDLLPLEPNEYRKAYFAQMRTGGQTRMVDSTERGSAREDDAYELIMQDKQRLLDIDEPVRFIFSHSALREGWDNPNVFQICTLREMGGETERRQTLGRGLRLPVAETESGYERVADRSVATLTVIANESYADYAQKLQSEYQAAGVAIGKVRTNEFAKLARLDASGKATDAICGYQWSKDVFDHLQQQGFIDRGMPTPQFRPTDAGFSLRLPEQLQPYETEIIELVKRAGLEKYVKSKSARAERKFNKALYASPEFIAFWNAISQKTTYRVQIEHDALIGNCVKAFVAAPSIPSLHVSVTRAGVNVQRGGMVGKELGTRVAELGGQYALPDIISELQHSTSLTRKTLVDILIQSGKLAEFIANPNDFIAQATHILKAELARIVVEGIQYEKIDGSIYELRELQADSEEEKERFLDQMVKISNWQQKTDFDYVVYDSDVEERFARQLDSREDIKLFLKLPVRFKVPTPVGDYNPDWAILKHADGEDRIYMIRETKSTHDRNKRRPSENAKIDAATEHFKAIGVGYEVTVPPPPGWNV